MVSMDAGLILISVWGVRQLLAAAKGPLHFGTIEDRCISWELSSLGNPGNSSLNIEITSYSGGIA